MIAVAKREAEREFVGAAGGGLERRSNVFVSITDRELLRHSQPNPAHKCVAVTVGKSAPKTVQVADF